MHKVYIKRLCNHAMYPAALNMYFVQDIKILVVFIGRYK